jgi:hypothetical protein
VKLNPDSEECQEDTGENTDNNDVDFPEDEEGDGDSGDGDSGDGDSGDGDSGDGDSGDGDP